MATTSVRSNLEEGTPFLLGGDQGESVGAHVVTGLSTGSTGKLAMGVAPSPSHVWGIRIGVLVQGGLFLAQLINAIYNVMAQNMLSKDGANALVFSVYRDLAAAPLLHMGARGLEGAVLPARADVPRIVLQGFLGVFCNQVLFLVGLGMTSATVAAIVNLTLPLFAAGLALAFGLDHFRWSTLAGLVLAVGGAMLMKMGGGAQVQGHQVSGFGVFVVALGAFASALYFIIQKVSLAKYPPISVTAWEYWIGFVFMTLAAVVTVEPGTQWSLSPNAQVALIFSVIFNSVAKYALNTFCNKHVSVVVLTVWSTLVPVLTAILSALFLQSPLQASYLGSIPIVIGTILVSKGRADAMRKNKDSSGSSKDRDDL